jgi:hypothetical protein
MAVARGIGLEIDRHIDIRGVDARDLPDMNYFA